MDFATMGKVGSYIKQKNLSFAANYKIRTGQRVMDNSGNLNFAETSMYDQINKATKKTEDEVKAARLRSIKQKLMNGKKLSDEEMGFLLKNDRDLYKKAKHADDAREELKSELKGAKSKQEAREILTRAMVKASAEATAELAACKGGIAMGAGSIDGLSMTGDVSVSTENLSTSIENISVNENPTSTENLATNENSNPIENNLRADEKTLGGKSDTNGILEKFIMTIRAIEDEWTKFANTDEYKNLPEDPFQDEKIYAVAEIPNRKLLNAIYTYRQSVNIA